MLCAIWAAVVGVVVRRRAAKWVASETVAYVVFALACRRDAPEPAATPEVEQIAPLHVAYAGCAEVWLEPLPRCLVASGSTLRLWLTQPDATRVAVRVDGEAWPTYDYYLHDMDGLGLELELPPNPEELTLELAEPRSRWSLPLGMWSEGMKPPSGIHSSNEVDQALGDAFTASEEGRHIEALKLLTKVEDLANQYSKGQADLATYRGIIYWGQGRYHDAATALREGVAFAIRLRDPGLMNDSIPIYAGVLAELGYLDAAADWSDHVLTSIRAEPYRIPCPAVGRVLSTVGYNHLLLARQQGRAPIHARPLLEQALARVGPHGECPDPTSVPAVLLSLADDALDRGDPSAALASLVDVDFERVPTSDQRLRLRDAELRALDGAGRPLDELEKSLARLEQEVVDAELPEGRWRLALRRGDLLVRRDRLEDAVVEYRRAEAEALQIAELAAVGVGRESAVALHGQSTERLIGTLAALGRTEEALCAAREAQARRIQGVGRASLTADQRDVVERAIEQYQRATRELDQARAEEHRLTRNERDVLRLKIAQNEAVLAKLANRILREQSVWRPSCEDLVPRRADELLLGLFPAGRDWFVFVQDDAGTTMRTLKGGPTNPLGDPALGNELVAPHDDRLAAARSIRVLAWGRAQELDVHLLPWRGAPLIKHASVTYGAELPRSDSTRPAAAAPMALLVADPTETLQKVDEEVRAAAGWMLARGWTLEVPSPAEADRTHVLQRLADASFFYFAGHGVHELGAATTRSLPPYAGGSQGWPAHLRLASGTKLEIQDILMLPSAPAHVALLGCQTGVHGSAGGGMSLALAFLVAGAEQVLATPVDTTDASALATALGVLDGMSGRDIDLAEGLRKAQVELLRRGEDVGRYRVWVR